MKIAWRAGSLILFRAPGEFARAYNAPPFLDGDGLPARHIAELFYLPAGPVNLHGVSLGVRAQAEGQHQLALRKVAGTAAQHLVLFHAGHSKVRHGADRKSVV